MAKGLLIEALAPVDEDESLAREGEEDDDDAPPPRRAQDPAALISSIETQLAELRRAISEL